MGLGLCGGQTWNNLLYCEGTHIQQVTETGRKLGSAVFRSFSLSYLVMSSLTH